MSLLHRSLQATKLPTNIQYVPRCPPIGLRAPIASQQPQRQPRCCCAPQSCSGSDAPEPQPPSPQQLDAASTSQPAAAAGGVNPPDAEQPQHMVASASSLGVPPGPMEPEDEQPKKLSASARLSEDLVSTSITIIGDDTDLNWAVCQALSKKIGWFPVSTAKILLGLHKAGSIQDLIDKDGRQALMEGEAKILRGMRDQLRCCISTVGDGASTDEALYQNLYGSIIIWLDEEDRRSPKPPSPTRAVHQAQSEVRAKLHTSKGGFGDKPPSLEEKASRAASQLVKTILQLLKENETLLARKRLYIEFGCRGDWPELKPEDWNPVLDGLDRKKVA